jgi:hypothetical protein
MNARPMAVARKKRFRPFDDSVLNQVRKILAIAHATFVRQQPRQRRSAIQTAAP